MVVLKEKDAMLRRIGQRDLIPDLLCDPSSASASAFRGNPLGKGTNRDGALTLASLR